MKKNIHAFDVPKEIILYMELDAKTCQGTAIS